MQQCHPRAAACSKQAICYKFNSFGMTKPPESSPVVQWKGWAAPIIPKGMQAGERSIKHCWPHLGPAAALLRTAAAAPPRRHPASQTRGWHPRRQPAGRGRRRPGPWGWPTHPGAGQIPQGSRRHLSGCPRGPAHGNHQEYLLGVGASGERGGEEVSRRPGRRGRRGRRGCLRLRAFT